MLTPIHEAAKNMLMISTKQLHSSTEPLPKTIKSPSNNKCVIKTYVDNFIPFKFPLDLVLLIMRLRPSITSKQNRGYETDIPI